MNRKERWSWATRGCVLDGMIAEQVLRIADQCRDMLSELILIEDSWAEQERGGWNRHLPPLTPWEEERLEFMRATIEKALNMDPGSIVNEG